MDDTNHWDQVVPGASEDRSGATTGAAGQSSSVKGAKVAKTNSSPRNDMVQIIYENQDFVSREDFDGHMKMWELSNLGINYHVISVFGSQSSGKSTLLNALFGTKFDVMDSNERSQTTKGIWASRDNENPMLILDVEGTDGHERAENEEFERKSSLFALAISEILIVNMFENQIGLYKGANMALLNTVLDVNLQIFQAPSNSKESSASLLGSEEPIHKTCLLFVIRDYCGDTPLENHEKVVRSTLEKIWDNLSKPKGKENLLFDDLFDLKLFALPHKKFAAPQFTKDVKVLKGLLREETSGDSEALIKTNYHKRIPIDGFWVYLKSVWDKIQDNKDLDLPSQQLLLAQFRCDEIMEEALQFFKAENEKIIAPIKEGVVVEDLGAQWNKLVKDTVDAKFSTEASRYNAHVYVTKKSELEAKIRSDLLRYYVEQLRNVGRFATNQFNTDLDIINTKAQNSTVDLSNSSAVEEHAKDFTASLNGAVEKAINYYRNTATASRLAESDWNFSNQFSDFKESIEKIAATKHREAMADVVEQASKNVNRILEDNIVLELNATRRDMWQKISLNLRNAVDDLVDDLTSKLIAFGASAEDTKQCVEAAKKSEWKFLYNVLEREAKDQTVVNRLTLKFDGNFAITEKGTPRIWEATDDIDSKFDESSKIAFRALDQLAIAKLDYSVLDATVVNAARGDLVQQRLRVGSLNNKKSSIDSDGKSLKKRLNTTSEKAESSGALESLPTTTTVKKEDMLKKSNFESSDDIKGEKNEQDDKCLIMIMDGRKEHIKRQATTEFRRKFIDAKTSLLTRTTKIPGWVYVAMIALGWNELMAIFSSPITFLFTIFISVALIFLVKMNLLKPMVALARNQIKQLIME